MVTSAGVYRAPGGTLTQLACARGFSMRRSLGSSCSMGLRQRARNLGVLLYALLHLL